MQVERTLSTRLNNYLTCMEEYSIIGWEEDQFFNCTTKYPFVEKQRALKNTRKTLPFIKHKLRDSKKLESLLGQAPPLTSHLLSPAKPLPSNITSIKFKNPKDSEHNRLRFGKNSKSVSSKGNRALSRLLLQLSPNHCASPKSNNFVLHGEKTRYFRKAGKRQTQCFLRAGEDKDPLFQQMLSMTIPCWKETGGKGKGGEKPVEEWFGGSKELIMNKVGKQIKGRRSQSQKFRL